MNDGSVYHTEMGSDAGSYFNDEIADPVSDESDLDLDQQLMSVYKFSSQCSHPTTCSTSMPPDEQARAKLFPTSRN